MAKLQSSAGALRNSEAIREHEPVGSAAYNRLQTAGRQLWCDRDLKAGRSMHLRLQQLRLRPHDGQICCRRVRSRPSPADGGGARLPPPLLL